MLLEVSEDGRGVGAAGPDDLGHRLVGQRVGELDELVDLRDVLLVAPLGEIEQKLAQPNRHLGAHRGQHPRRHVIQPTGECAGHRHQDLGVILADLEEVPLRDRRGLEIGHRDDLVGGLLALLEQHPAAGDVARLEDVDDPLDPVRRDADHLGQAVADEQQPRRGLKEGNDPLILLELDLAGAPGQSPQPVRGDPVEGGDVFEEGNVDHARLPTQGPPGLDFSEPIREPKYKRERREVSPGITTTGRGSLRAPSCSAWRSRLRSRTRRRPPRAGAFPPRRGARRCRRCPRSP